jgi:RNA-binding protein NOB1
MHVSGAFFYQPPLCSASNVFDRICKDNSKKFCPACGGATLLRTSVTVSTPSASSKTPAMQVHLKKNFQYRNRGTVYSIPSPKPGSAKTGSGEGLILREDQTEYMRAVKRADAKRQRDEKKVLSSGGTIGALGVGNWMDPDWVPDIISAGASGKGRTNGRNNELPVIGHGRRNPNERRHRKK